MNPWYEVGIVTALATALLVVSLLFGSACDSICQAEISNYTRMTHTLGGAHGSP